MYCNYDVGCCEICGGELPEATELIYWTWYDLTAALNEWHSVHSESWRDYDIPGSTGAVACCSWECSVKMHQIQTLIEDWAEEA